MLAGFIFLANMSDIDSQNYRARIHRNGVKVRQFCQYLNLDVKHLDLQKNNINNTHEISLTDSESSEDLTREKLSEEIKISSSSSFGENKNFQTTKFQFQSFHRKPCNMPEKEKKSLIKTWLKKSFAISDSRDNSQTEKSTKKLSKTGLGRKSSKASVKKFSISNVAVTPNLLLCQTLPDESHGHKFLTYEEIEHEYCGCDQECGSNFLAGDEHHQFSDPTINSFTMSELSKQNQEDIEYDLYYLEQDQKMEAISSGLGNPKDSENENVESAQPVLRRNSTYGEFYENEYLDNDAFVAVPQEFFVMQLDEEVDVI